jgi:hypothetical protein
MSALTQLPNICNVLTSTVSISSMSFGGIFGTDYKHITYEPYGIDKNGVAKWRAEDATVSSSLWPNVTYSHKSANTATGKATTKLIVSVPFVTGSGTTAVTRVTRGTLTIDAFNDNSITDRKKVLLAVWTAMNTLFADIANGRTIY